MLCGNACLNIFQMEINLADVSVAACVYVLL